jgi:hypothetical protein
MTVLLTVTVILPDGTNTVPAGTPVFVAFGKADGDGVAVGVGEGAGASPGDSSSLVFVAKPPPLEHAERLTANDTEIRH